MVHTIYVSTSLPPLSSKVNVELENVLSMDDLKIKAVFAFRTHIVKCGRQYEPNSFSVARFRIFDDFSQQWRDVLDFRQVCENCQLFAVPTAVFGGQQPQSRPHSSDRFISDMTSIQHTSSPREASKRRHVSPPVRQMPHNATQPVTRAPTTPIDEVPFPSQSRLAQLNQELEAARRYQATLQQELTAASSEVADLTKQLMTGSLRSKEEEEIAELRKKLLTVQMQLDQKPSQGDTCDVNDEKLTEFPLEYPVVKETCSLLDDFISFFTVAERKEVKTYNEEFDDCDVAVLPAASARLTGPTRAQRHQESLVPVRDRLVKFLTFYQQNTSCEAVDGHLYRWKGRENKMFEALRREFGPEPGAPLPNKQANERLKQRLRTFYCVHEPTKLQNVENIAKLFSGREEELFEKLVKMYGPEPTSAPQKEPAHRDPASTTLQKPIYNDHQQVDLALVRQASIGPPAPPHRQYRGPGPSEAVVGISALLCSDPKPMFDGEAYKIVTESMTQVQPSHAEWYFYNDSQKYELHIRYEFGPNSNISFPSRAVGNVKRSMSSKNHDWHVVEAVVYPFETTKFLEGTPNGFKSNVQALPLSETYIKADIRASAMTASAQLQMMETVVAPAAREEARRRYRKRLLVNEKKEPSYYETAVEEECAVLHAVKQGIPYVDMNFPPTQRSLSRVGQDRRTIEDTAWKRPTQYLPQEIHSYIATHRHIDPNDIDQGMLGDCWFLSAVASLAEFPSKVRDIFEHPSGILEQHREEKLGAYRVTLNKNGWWHVLIIDDYFPCVGNKPCFAKNVEDSTELWPCLIEKAYAKLHGSFAAIAGGDALHALQDLTGYPVCRFSDDEWIQAQQDPRLATRLFQTVLQHDEDDHLISLSTPGVDTRTYNSHVGGHVNAAGMDEMYKQAGLGLGHAYSLLECKEFPKEPNASVHGGPLRMCKIRNPWGNGLEWTGAWSDDDERWLMHPEVAAACGYSGSAPDGTFWMEWEDVLKYFDGGGACLTKFNWFDYRVRGMFRRKLNSGYVLPSLCLHIEVTKPTNAFLILSQKDKRVKDADESEEYQPLLLSLARTTNNRNGRMEVACNSTSNPLEPSSRVTFCYDRHRSMKVTLLPQHSPYIVVPRIYNNTFANDAVDCGYVLGVISERRAGMGIDVSFQALSGDDDGSRSKLHPLFDSFVNFRQPTFCGVECDYQFNPEVGCPLDCRGASLSNV